MTTEELRAIVQERLAGWAEISVREHQTPVVMVAVGHDHAKGKLGLCTPQDGAGIVVTDQILAGFLRWAVQQLDPGHDVDEGWAASTLLQVLDHLRTHAYAGCASCTAWVRGHGGTVGRG